MSALSATDLAVDRELASISESFSFLVDLTPTNVDEAREAFLTDLTSTPSFDYRHLEDFPEVIGARLRAVDLASVEDPTLAHLFAAKKKELELQLDMLAARDTDDFLPLSTELYGAVTPALEETAEEILTQVPRKRSAGGRCLSAQAFSRKAKAELDFYRDLAGDLSVSIEIRDDTSGVMVSNGNLLIAESSSVASSRLPGLLAHEIGTHVLTYVNGTKQPLKLLAAGLAGYEETQEGLALIAEAMVGGLTVARLRQIAARVIAVRRMLKGSHFGETHSELVERFGYSRGGAFTIVMRVYRSGGFTKDAVYLRGLQDLVKFVAEGQDLNRLWVGKLALIDLPLIDELRQRSVVFQPVVLPRFFDDPQVRARLDAVASNQGLHTLIGAGT